MSKKHRDRIVTILAVNPKYKERTGYLPAMYNSVTKNYEIGFEDKLDPDVDRGKVLKALGVSDDPKKGVKIEELMVPISHGQPLNLMEDYDYGVYCVAKSSGLVSMSSRAVDKNVHLFFINDIKLEAKTDLAEETKIFKAKEMIFKEAQTSKLKSLCIFLGGIDVRQADHDFLLSKALKQAETRPDDIMSFYAGKHDNETFIKELYHYGVIQYKDGRYHDGEIFMGSMDESLTFVGDQKNSKIVNSLGERLLEKKGK